MFIQVTSQALDEMEEVIVTSSTEEKRLSDLAVPIKVLNANALEQLTGNNLGTLLSSIPGVANADYGLGVGRPVLRGLGGNRVKMMLNGIDAGDVSAVSSDHAVMIDPVNADQIEIIQGPATLFYGSGAIGGVVNTVKKRIHQEKNEGVEGSFTLLGATNDDQQQFSGLIDVGVSSWVMHLEGFSRNTNNYESAKGQVNNSDVKGNGGNAALSYIADAGYVGMSISQIDYDYAVPNEQNDDVRITPHRFNIVVEAQYLPEWNGVESLSAEFNFSEYYHKEWEADLAEGLFEKDQWQFKSWLNHQAFLPSEGSIGIDFRFENTAVCHDHDGCSHIQNYSGKWDGTRGDHLLFEQGYWLSHASPMPRTEVKKWGAFVIEELNWARGLLSYGLRFDYIKLDPEPNNIAPENRQKKNYYEAKEFTIFNVDLAHKWIIGEHNNLIISLARSEREPDAEALFYNGSHHATFSYQLDNPNLNKEIAYTAALHWQLNFNRVQLDIDGFYYRFKDYIYNQSQGFDYHHDHHHDHDHHHEHQDHEHSEVVANSHIEGLEAVYRHQQRDADFYGFEWSLHWQPIEQYQQFDIHFYGDWLNAELRHSSERYLPRMPPSRLGLSLRIEENNWLLQTSYRFVAAQNKVPAEDTTTKSYALLDMQSRYRFSLQQTTLWIALKANNITNEYGQNALSFLKQAAPLMGRQLLIELGVNF